MTAQVHEDVREFVERRGLTLHKNVRWEMADYDTTGPDDAPDRDATTDIAEAEAVSSLRAGSDFRNGEGLHDLLIDIDIEAHLVPSSTTDHHHLYVPLACKWEKYVAFLEAAADIGLIEEGYANACISRGATSLRLPWVPKGSEREAVENGGSLPPKRKPFGHDQKEPF